MALAKFVERVLARLVDTPVDLSLLKPATAPFSISAGGAGVAFFLHEAGRLRGQDALFPLARRWCEAARESVERSAPGAWSGAPFGFVQGEGGLSYVEALVSVRDSDPSGVLAAVERIERGAARLGENVRFKPTELFAGAAGIASATRCLEARLPPAGDYAACRGVLKRVRDRALGLVLERYGAALDPGPSDPLGFAHGIAGELWALVAVLGADHELVGPRLAELFALREIDEEELVYWLPHRRSDSTSFLGALCNGVPGHTLLWCEVARQTHSDAALEIAGLCARSAEILLTPVPTLCCGLAGQAVALQRYAEVSGEKRFGRIAQARLLRATRIAERDMTPFLSLWTGMLGVALVAMGFLHEERTLPCLEPLPQRE